METGIEPERYSQKKRETGKLVKSSTKSVKRSNNDSSKQLEEPGITENQQASGRRLRHWTSEAQILGRRLVPSKEPKKSLRKIEQSVDSEKKINFRSLARASKTGISSLKMIKSIIIDSKDSNKSRSRRKFDISDKMKKESKLGQSNSVSKNEKQTKAKTKNSNLTKNEKMRSNKNKKVSKTGPKAQEVSRKPKKQPHSSTYGAPFQPFRPGATINISELNRASKNKQSSKRVKGDTKNKARNPKAQRGSRSRRGKQELGRSLGPVRSKDQPQIPPDLKLDPKLKLVKRVKPKSKRTKYNSNIGFGLKKKQKKKDVL